MRRESNVTNEISWLLKTPGFVWVEENLESHGILECHFPGLDRKALEFNCGTSWEMILITKYKLNWVLSVKENCKNITKMKMLIV